MSAVRVLSVAGIAALCGIGAYALYFDHQRRNDITFRRKLKRDQKQLRKAADQDAQRTNQQMASALKSAVEQVSQEELPTTIEDREQYFLRNVAEGERLAALGSKHFLEAATNFFRAVKVYPQPLELVMIYQKTVPEPIFELIMSMMGMEAGTRQE